MSILKINHHWRTTFFLVRPTSIQISHFPLIFRTFLFPSSSLKENFNFLTKNKTSKACSFVSSENKPSKKRSFLLSPAQIYPNIIFSIIFRNFLFPSSTWLKFQFFGIKNTLISFTYINGKPDFSCFLCPSTHNRPLEIGKLKILGFSPAFIGVLFCPATVYDRAWSSVDFSVYFDGFGETVTEFAIFYGFKEHPQFEIRVLILVQKSSMALRCSHPRNWTNNSAYPPILKRSVFANGPSMIHDVPDIPHPIRTLHSAFPRSEILNFLNRTPEVWLTTLRFLFLFLHSVSHIPSTSSLQTKLFEISLLLSRYDSFFMVSSFCFHFFLF